MFPFFNGKESLGLKEVISFLKHSNVTKFLYFIKY